MQQNVDGHGNGDERIKRLPMSKEHQPECRDYSEASPTVGQYMFSVCFEDQRMGAAADMKT